jgi:DNA-binding transcriptional MerR regulator|tara:strand:- start:1010 stop:1396 length:387 start_codon:yes stop_codon:yes gene_type:complete
MGVIYNISMSERKIICKVTGKGYTFGQDYFDKKVKDYIDKDNLKKYFITKKAKNYLNKGYSVQEIRNILNVNEEDLPTSDSQEIVELIEFHKIQASHTAKKISNTLNFATHKSDSEVAEFINTIRDYE